MQFSRIFQLSLILTCIGCSYQFYLPGIAPRSFCKKGDVAEGCENTIDVLVNRLDSFETVIPYDYHKFDFCEAPEVNRELIIFLN